MRISFILVSFLFFQIKLTAQITTELLKTSSDSIIIQIDLHDFEFKTSKLADYYVLDVSDLLPIAKKNTPDLLQFVRSIIIDDNGGYELEILDAQYIIRRNIKIAPSIGHIKRSINPDSLIPSFGAVYTKNEYFPNKIAEISKPFIFKEHRALRLLFYPFQYNPVREKLRIYSSVSILIYKSSKNGINEKKRLKKSHSTIFDDFYSKYFLNYSSHYKYSSIVTQSRMLVLCPPRYSAMMKEFIDWKQELAFDINLVDSIDFTNNQVVSSFIEAYYQTKGLDYLLIVGDAEDIAPMDKNGPSDAAFGHIEGDDSYPELIVGRFSCENEAELKTQIDRTIAYEKQPESGNWIAKAVLIASAEGEGAGDDNEGDWQHMQNIRIDLENYGYIRVDELYDGTKGGNDLEGNPMPEDLSLLLNEGRGLLAYVGHGADDIWSTSGFTNKDVFALENVGKLPFIFDVACLNGNFVGQTCFAEAWMRAQYNNQAVGAIAIIASTINQDWMPPMAAQDEMIDLLTEISSEKSAKTFGLISLNACMLMNEEYGEIGAVMTDTWTIFGDPSIVLRTKEATQISVFHEPNLFLAQEATIVKSSTENAVVSIIQSNEIISKGQVENGQIIATFNRIELAKPVELTVSAPEMIPYMYSFPVHSLHAPFLINTNVELININGKSSDVLDYGKKYFLKITTKNNSDMPLNNVKAYLYCQNNDIQIIKDSVFIGSIDGNEEIVTLDSFVLNVSNEISNAESVDFKLIYDGTEEGVWTSEFSIQAVAPELEFSFQTVIDQNNNAQIDANESLLYHISLKNVGNADLDSVYFKLNSLENNFQVLTDGQWFYDIAANESVDFAFELVASNTIINEFTFSLDVVFLDTLNYILSFDNRILVEDWESGIDETFDWNMGSSAQWTIDSTESFDGQNSLRSASIGNGETSSVSLKLNLLFEDSFSFYSKVSTELDYDFLQFYVDGELIDSWSGELNWRKNLYKLSEGEHIIKWSYAKDVYMLEGSDAVWIDSISIPSSIKEQFRPEFLSFPDTSYSIVDSVDYLIKIDFFDSKDNDLYSVNLPNWLKLDSVSSEYYRLFGFCGDADWGDFEIKLVASNNFGSTNQFFNLHISRPPVFTNTPLDSVNQDDIYIFKPEFYSEDINSVNLSLKSAPQWLFLRQMQDSSYLLRGKPNGIDVGEHEIVLSLMDGKSENVLQNTTLRVLDINDMPIIYSKPDSLVFEDDEYVYLLQVSDIDDIDILDLELLYLPSWLNYRQLSSRVWEFSGWPDVQNVGVDSVKLQVSDLEYISEQKFIISVLNRNDLPIFSVANSDTTLEDFSFDKNYFFTDEEGDSIKFDLLTKPNWIAYTKTSETAFALSGTPTNSEVGESILEFWLTDFVDTAVIKYTIVVENVNDAPFFISSTIDTAYFAMTYESIIYYKDIDSKQLELNIVSSPDWIKLEIINDTSALLFGDVPIITKENQIVRLSISDKIDTVYQDFELYFSSTNSISDFAKTDDFKVYPNPASDYIRIKQKSGIEIEKLEIWDAQSKLISSQSSEFQYIVLTNFEIGVYFLVFYTKTGLFYTKLVIEK